MGGARQDVTQFLPDPLNVSIRLVYPELPIVLLRGRAPPRQTEETEKSDEDNSPTQAEVERRMIPKQSGLGQELEMYLCFV